MLAPWTLLSGLCYSHYNIYDDSAVGYITHVHCIILLYSDGTKIHPPPPSPTATTSIRGF